MARRPSRLAFIALSGVLGCATVHPSSERAETALRSQSVPEWVRRGDPPHAEVAARARAFLAHRYTPARKDCSGLVEAVYRSLGLHLPMGSDLGLGSSVASLYEGLAAEGALFRRRPAPGDVAFFSNTYDRNRNDRCDDPLTHVALVVAVDREGTITLVHYGSRGVASLKMNLREPGRQRDGRGGLINDRLRERGEPACTGELAAELFVAFGRPVQRNERIARR